MYSTWKERPPGTCSRAPPPNRLPPYIWIQYSLLPIMLAKSVFMLAYSVEAYLDTTTQSALKF